MQSILNSYNYNDFLDYIFQQLKVLNIDVSEFKIDHIASRSTTLKKYLKIKSEALEIGSLIGEVIIQNRPIAIIKLDTPIKYKSQKIIYFEIIAPTKSNTFLDLLEHVEFIIPFSLNKLLQLYPHINWNKDGFNRKVSPDLIVELPNHKSVKFRTMCLEDSYIKQQKLGEL